MSPAGLASPALDWSRQQLAYRLQQHWPNKKFLEYITYHGTYADVPVDEILAASKRAYGEARIEGWIRRLAEGGMETGRDFARDEVYRG